jgi:hypothetical protein
VEILGYPLTYPTICFIGSGCGARVYAHTNGNGDFVLLDELRPPWTVHSCYLNRFCPPGELNGPRPPSGVYTDQEWALHVARHNAEYKEAARRAARERGAIPVRAISKVDPKDLPLSSLQVLGYVQDIVERRAEKIMKGRGDLAQQALRKALGTRDSQITVVDPEFNSYTMFVDIRQKVVAKRTTVLAQIRAIKVLGLGAIFLCDELDVLPLKE